MSVMHDPCLFPVCFLLASCLFHNSLTVLGEYVSPLLLHSVEIFFSFSARRIWSGSSHLFQVVFSWPIFIFLNLTCSVIPNPLPIWCVCTCMLMWMGGLVTDHPVFFWLAFCYGSHIWRLTVSVMVTLYPQWAGCYGPMHTEMVLSMLLRTHAHTCTCLPDYTRTYISYTHAQFFPSRKRKIKEHNIIDQDIIGDRAVAYSTFDYDSATLYLPLV